MTSALPHDCLDRFLDRALDGERDTAIRMTLDLLDTGMAKDQVIVDLLAAAQREVGERWFRNELTIAAEHVATGVSRAALDALVDDVVPLAGAGHTVVTCAEGDWHSLAAQMFGALLHAQGGGVTVLGASVPADAVADFLVRRNADSLAVSCTLSTNFVGVTRLVDAAHQVDCPVIVGGRALGSDGRRADRLGADGWAASAAEAFSILERWRVVKPPISHEATMLSPDALRLDARATDLGMDALDELRRSYPPFADLDERHIARTLDDLIFIVEYIAAALLTDDDTVFTDADEWLHAMVVNRGGRSDGLVAGLVALRPAIEEIDPRASRLLDAGQIALRRTLV